MVYIKSKKKGGENMEVKIFSLNTIPQGNSNSVTMPEIGYGYITVFQDKFAGIISFFSGTSNNWNNPIYGNITNGDLSSSLKECLENHLQFQLHVIIR